MSALMVAGAAFIAAQLGPAVLVHLAAQIVILPFWLVFGERDHDSQVRSIVREELARANS